MLGIADSVIGIAGKVLDKFVEDKDLKKKLDHQTKQSTINVLDHKLKFIILYFPFSYMFYVFSYNCNSSKPL